ncbi:MAG: excinuclease ABC subunit C [Deltaproteobacteria bacterium]|nr:excinuclease ABC subunit UvrC [Deltaproteobacteria bacterium]MBW2546861.1 excinuclease ABC subunit UvrC [Deltaproteobacteria bacterium]MBW2718527.1 excinuclease ABC subunit UvrC [Deltaproteobacteria bacterium]RLB51949.1 MAG: excinuclease ABC subunit C [Deltaproteobacteria bacterium]
MIADAAQRKLDKLPASPGVYVFHGEDGKVLYVGKARSLRNRVRSYFQPGSSDVRAFVNRLERELIDIETFVTHTDKEAALLENQLIKSHQPKYNVKLRDDKEFLSLRLDAKKPWPRLEVVRRPKPDGSQYFGPYHSATAARQTLRLVNRYFQLRTCTDIEFRLRSRPCLQYQIKRCPGPCVLEVDQQEYRAQVVNVARFLDGRHGELVRDIDGRMKGASGELEYERAAVYRDQLRAVERAQEEQRVAGVQKSDQDVIGFHRQGDQVEIAVLSMRGGRLFSLRTLPLRKVAVPNDEMLGAFLRQHYAERTSLPDDILVPVSIEMSEALEELLSENRKRRVRIVEPKRGAKAKLLDLAKENAEHAFAEKERAREDVEARLRELQKLLRLPVLPRRIECVDISHTGGEETVGVFVALQDGVPAKERYRSFRVKRVSGGDDYAAMYEVLMRRLRRAKNDEKGWELPDLLVVDGGKGQLGVAVRAREDVGVPGLEVASVAKPRVTAAGQEEGDRVFLPGQKNPIPVRANSALSLLLLARDETHRASNTLRHKIGRKRRLRSELDGVPGVGPKTRGKLLRNLGSLREVLAATEAQLIEAGATKRQAEAIRRTLGSHAPDAESAEDTAVENAFQPD